MRMTLYPLNTSDELEAWCYQRMHFFIYTKSPDVTSGGDLYRTGWCIILIEDTIILSLNKIHLGHHSKCFQIMEY
jgi:hypothetical protein